MIVIGKEKYGYTVALMTDSGYFEHCKPLAIGVDKATAKSIWRHYESILPWGQYIKVVSREFCKNHKDFEREW